MMRSTMILTAAFSLAAALPCAAAEPAPSQSVPAAASKPADNSAKAQLHRLVGGLRTFFEHLKDGLSESSVASRRQSQIGAAAVAAVRGTKQSSFDLDTPVWKSSQQSRRLRLDAAQKEELSTAVELALDGKLDDADEKLVAFEKQHPDSRFLREAKQARERLREARGGSQR